MGQPERSSEVKREWALWVLLAALAFGTFAAALMTWHHEQQLFGGAMPTGDLFGCSATAEVNCDVVNTSRWSELFGVPIAALALATYLALGALVFFALQGRRGAIAIVFGAGVGMTLYSAFLFYIAKTELDYLCAWCLRMYAVNLAVPILAALAGRLRKPEPATWARAAAAFAAAAALVVGGQQLYRRSLQSGEIVLPEGGLHDEPSQGPAPSRDLVVTVEGEEIVLRIEVDDAWRGDRDAEVVVVEFSDFQCPFCRLAAGAMEPIYQRYGDRVLFVFKHFPLNKACNPALARDLHPNACAAAEAAICARAQGRFWTFHDLMFANQEHLAPGRLPAYAERAGLDPAGFDACRAAPATRAALGRSIALGEQLQVPGTPAFYIDGALYKGRVDTDAIAAALDKALAKGRPQ